jgi:hypothetical protein
MSMDQVGWTVMRRSVLLILMMKCAFVVKQGKNTLSKVVAQLLSNKKEHLGEGNCAIVFRTKEHLVEGSCAAVDEQENALAKVEVADTLSKAVAHILKVAHVKSAWIAYAPCRR